MNNPDNYVLIFIYISLLNGLFLSWILSDITYDIIMKKYTIYLSTGFVMDQILLTNILSNYFYQIVMFHYVHN